jgi:hypothetical protein
VSYEYLRNSGEYMRVMHQYLEIIYQFSPFGILQKIYLNKDIKPIITKKLGINKMASAINQLRGKSSPQNRSILTI